MTRRDLSRQSAVSERYIAQFEGGSGNGFSFVLGEGKMLPEFEAQSKKAKADFEDLFVDDPNDFRIAPCFSPVWDTAINAIALAESGLDVVDIPGTYGVFAAEAPNVRLEAQIDGDRITLSGIKPWCSLGDALDYALVAAHVGHERQLFKVDLHDPSVRADPPERWVARGLRTVTSGPVRFDQTPAEPVGAPGWYLERPGFAWGGIGVAACWHGGAQGIADTVRHTSARRTGEVNALHVGAIDAALFGSASALVAASRHVDSGEGCAEVLALRARAVVADAVERVLHQAGHALGPAPLAFDDDHATRVADLHLYVRQHHGESR